MSNDPSANSASSTSKASPGRSQTLRQGRSGAWPLTLVLIVLMVVVGGPVGYMLITVSRGMVTAPERLASSLSLAAAEAVRPHLTLNEIVVNSVADLHKENKLVVLTVDVDADVTRQEGSSSWGMYWGTNTARVAVKGACVHYVLDLDKMQTSDFIYSEQAKVLSVLVPPPRLDTSMVSIDPARIQTLELRGGWMRWDKYDTRDQAIAELRPRVITQAQAPYVRQLASAGGIESMTRLLQPLADTIARDGVTLRVQYQPRP